MSEDTGLHVGDVGAVIEVTVNENGAAADISTVTTKQLKLEKPSGEVLSKDAAFTSDGSDGKIRYTTLADDLDEYGIWDCRAYLVFPGGWTGHTSKTTFEVFKV